MVKLYPLILDQRQHLRLHILPPYHPPSPYYNSSTVEPKVLLGSGLILPADMLLFTTYYIYTNPSIFLLLLTLLKYFFIRLMTTLSK